MLEQQKRIGRGASLSEYCTAGKFLSEKERMMHPRRILDSFVLLYGVTGTVHLSDGDRRYELGPDDYLILVANREHGGTKYSPPGVSYYWCHFYLHGEYCLSEDADGGEMLCFGEGGRFCIPLFGQCQSASRMHVLFHQLLDCSRTESPFSGVMCQNFLETLLCELAVSATLADAREKSSRGTVEAVLQWVRLNACQIRGVKDVAAYFGYNSEYLTTMIRRVTGKTLVRHVNEQRISTAKTLLRTTRYTLQQIAELCGFVDEKYFSRVFKQHCDLSPGRFREVYAKKHVNQN